MFSTINGALCSPKKVGSGDTNEPFFLKISTIIGIHGASTGKYGNTMNTHTHIYIYIYIVTNGYIYIYT